MGQKISKPDANPMVACLLCLILNLGHLVINGQQKKWLISLIGCIIPCCGLVVLIFSMMDAYATAVKLKAGKEIDENEYSNAMLFKICKIVHKDAILVLPSA